MKTSSLLLLVLLLYACTDSNEYFEYWPNGNVKEKRLYNPQYDRGEGNYEVWGYDEAGSLIFAGHRINGKKNGDWTEYHANGNVKTKGTYRADIKMGDFMEYAPNGNLKVQYSTNHIGQLEGDYQVYDTMAQVIISGQYRNDITIGEWTYTNADGSYERIEYAEDGQVNFEQRHPNGSNGDTYEFIARNKYARLDSVGAFLNGQRSGYWQIYARDGEYLRMEGEFVAGQKEGEWKYWSEDSILLERGIYTAGQRLGLWTIRDASGVLRTEKYYDEKGIRVLNHWRGKKQSLKDGKGYIDEFVIEDENTIRVRTYYRNAKQTRSTRSVIR